MAQGRWLALVLGGVWACNSGPISDFPFTGSPDDTGGKSPSVSLDGGVPATVGPQTGETSASDAASAELPTGYADAGAIGITPGGPVYDTDAGGRDADADAGDADAGEPAACPPVGALSVNEPQCVGDFCGLSLSELSAASGAGGACSDDPVALRAVCSGALPTRVAECAQSELAAGHAPSSASLAACLAGAGEPLGGARCGACFADEASCALSACSASFLAGDPKAAAQCRALLCAPSFAVCSGLPIAGF